MRSLFILALLAFSTSSGASLKAEAECMARTMYAEASNQGKRGILAVAHVIKTRKKIERKSACAVTRPGQFARANVPTKLRGMYLETAMQVLSGKTADPTGGATHFFRRGSRTPAWYDKGRSRRIQDHVFVNVAAYAAQH